MSHLRSLLQPTLALAAVSLAALAQYLHSYRQSDGLALALLACALLCWGVALFIGKTVLSTFIVGIGMVGERPRVLSKWLLVSAVVLAVLTFFISSGNAFTSDNVLAWILSIGVFLYVFWIPEKNGHEWRMWLSDRARVARESVSNGFRLSPQTVMLIGIVLVGIFFYYYDLDGVPAEMDSDHAEKLLDVNDVVNGGLAPIFFERNTGREPLQFYLTAGFINLTGHPLDHMALKLITALMGVGVILLTFLFARELFGDTVGLWAALGIALAKWPVTIARMGLRFPFTPVFIAPLMYFLFRALKYQRRNDFLVAGLVLGAGLYGYNAFRIAPLLVVGFLVLWLMIDRRLWSWSALRRYMTNAGLMLTAMVLVLLPLLRYMTENPEMVWYRVATRLVGEGEAVTDNIVLVLVRNLWNVALMFNWAGDSAWPNSVIGDPALDYVMGGLFLLGIVIALYHWFVKFEWAYAFVLIGLGVMLLPSALSIAFPNENPSIVRAGGAIPFTFILVALSFTWIARTLRHSLAGFRWGRWATFAVMALIVLVAARANFLRYFRDFDASYRQFSWNSLEVAEAIRGFADSVGDVEHAWILLYPHWVDTRNVAINLHQLDWEQTLPSADDALSNANDNMNKLYVLNLKDSPNLIRLEEIFPNGQRRVFQARTSDHDFILFYVPGTVSPTERLESR